MKKSTFLLLGSIVGIMLVSIIPSFSFVYFPKYFGLMMLCSFSFILPLAFATSYQFAIDYNLITKDVLGQEEVK